MAKEYKIGINYVTGWSNTSNPRTGFVIGWSAEGIGFGELTIFAEPKGNTNIHEFHDQNEWHCENEGMSRDFVKAVLAKLGDIVKLDFGKDD